MEEMLHATEMKSPIGKRYHLKIAMIPLKQILLVFLL